MNFSKAAISTVFFSFKAVFHTIFSFLTNIYWLGMRR
jgi:hypothetical protein